VITTLGGGKFGHVDLVCNHVRYTKIPGISPYACPTQSVLNFLQNAMGTQLVANQEVYQEKIKLYCEVNAIKCIFMQHLVQAVEPKYLIALCNNYTNKITATIPQIFYHCFYTYGSVTKQKTKGITYKSGGYAIQC
jgi:hypothetical protein